MPTTTCPRCGFRTSYTDDLAGALQCPGCGEDLRRDRRAAAPARDPRPVEREDAAAALEAFDAEAGRAARWHVVAGPNGPALRTPWEGLLRGAQGMLLGLVALLLPFLIPAQGGPFPWPFLVLGLVVFSLSLAWGLLGRHLALRSLRWWEELHAKRDALRAKYGLPPERVSLRWILDEAYRGKSPMPAGRPASRVKWGRVFAAMVVLAGLAWLGVAAYVLWWRGGWAEHLAWQQAMWNGVGAAGQWAIVALLLIAPVSFVAWVAVLVLAVGGPVVLLTGVVRWGQAE